MPDLRVRVIDILNVAYDRVCEVDSYLALQRGEDEGVVDEHLNRLSTVRDHICEALNFLDRQNNNTPIEDATLQGKLEQLSVAFWELHGNHSDENGMCTATGMVVTHCSMHNCPFIRIENLLVRLGLG